MVEAIRRQAGELLFYSNAVYSPVRARAAEALTSLAPEPLNRVFWCNSGTEANETALKLARATTGRSRVVAFSGGFHGRTLGALAATYGDKYHAPYRAILPQTTWLPFGWQGAVRDEVQKGDVAAVILEPMQSMAGITEADPAFYQRAPRDLRRDRDRPHLRRGADGRRADGRVSRTATTWASTPDLITLAKSLGAGVPVGAVLVSGGDRGGRSSRATRARRSAAGCSLWRPSRRRCDQLGERRPDGPRPDRHLRPSRGRSDRQGLDAVDRRCGDAGVFIGVDAGDRPAGPVRDALRTTAVGDHDGVIVGTANEPNTIRLMPPLTIDRRRHRCVP